MEFVASNNSKHGTAVPFITLPEKEVQAIVQRAQSVVDGSGLNTQHSQHQLMAQTFQRVFPTPNDRVNQASIDRKADEKANGERSASERYAVLTSDGSWESEKTITSSAGGKNMHERTAYTRTCSGSDAYIFAVRALIFVSTAIIFQTILFNFYNTAYFSDIRR